jgi:hypothetical protein
MDKDALVEHLGSGFKEKNSFRILWEPNTFIMTAFVTLFYLNYKGVAPSPFARKKFG